MYSSVPCVGEGIAAHTISSPTDSCDKLNHLNNKSHQAFANFLPCPLSALAPTGLAAFGRSIQIPSACHSILTRCVCYLWSRGACLVIANLCLQEGRMLSDFLPSIVAHQRTPSANSAYIRLRTTHDVCAHMRTLILLPVLLLTHPLTPDLRPHALPQ